jgi:hypothetical protein
LKSFPLKMGTSSKMSGYATKRELNEKPGNHGRDVGVLID